MPLPVTNTERIPGVDPVNDVTRVERQFNPAAISTAATTVIKSGSGLVGEIICSGGVLGGITIYDNTAASGTVLLPTVTPIQGQVLLRDIQFNVGLTIVTTLATVLTVAYR